MNSPLTRVSQAPSEGQRSTSRKRALCKGSETRYTLIFIETMMTIDVELDVMTKVKIPCVGKGLIIPRDAFALPPT
jgi:hypothetical protein